MEWLVNGFSIFTRSFNNFFNLCKTFFQVIVDLCTNTASFFQTLWFGVKTLFSGISTIIRDVFSYYYNGSIFDYLFDGFNSLSGYIGLPGALFFSSILFVIMVRIIISFVFKMFRLNVDYKTMKTKWK